jgi:hypothetical protein
VNGHAGHCRYNFTSSQFDKRNNTHFTNRIDGVMISVLAFSEVDIEFEPRAGQPKDYKIGICCFSAALKNKSKYWLAQNQNTVSEWSDLYICGLLFQ